MSSLKFVVFGGGGKVARLFAKIAAGEGHEVVSVIRNDAHAADLKSLGAKPAVLSLEDASVSDLTALLTTHKPSAVVFSAGAGGKGDKSRTRKVDFEAAVRVFDALEQANVKRLVYIGAIDVRSRNAGYPDYYTEASKKKSDEMWESLAEYMQAKLDAEKELHTRKAIKYTVLRPGYLTEEPAKGAEAGITQIAQTSRELVAQAILASIKEPRTEGLTIDLMDGENSLEAELKKVADGKIDAWQELIPGRGP